MCRISRLPTFPSPDCLVLHLALVFGIGYQASQHGLLPRFAATNTTPIPNYMILSYQRHANILRTLLHSAAVLPQMCTLPPYRSFPTDQHVKKQIHSTPRGGLRRIRKAYPYHPLLTRLLPAADIEGVGTAPLKQVSRGRAEGLANVSQSWLWSCCSKRTGQLL